MLSRRHVIAAATGALLAPHALMAVSRPLRAQTFSRPLRIVVPYPAGGPTDALARIVAQEITGSVGQNVVVENKPGGSGSIGTREVARAEPDGHTLVLGNNQTHATNAFLLQAPGYDPVKDFAPIAGLADLQHAFVVRKDFPATDVRSFVAYARANPGKLNYGSTGVGSGSHLAMELFKTITGLDIQHIPFTGAAPLAQEILAGRIDVSFATLPSVLGLIQADQIRALAIASTVRAPQVPDVPLLKEQGVQNGEADSWLALFAPAATPAAVRAVLSKAVLDAVARPAVAAGIVKLGIALNPRPAESFTGYLGAELEKWAGVIRSAGLKPN